MRARQTVLLLLPCVLSFAPQPFHHRATRRLRATEPSDVELDPADEDAAPILLKDPKTKRSIECYPHSYAKIPDDAMQYVVAVPCDPCIEICAVDPESDALTTIEIDSALMEMIYPVARQLLAEDELELVNSATTLTLSGDLEVDEEDLDDEGFEQDLELASFEYENDEYAIIKVGMPLMLVAQALDLETGNSPEGYTLLDDQANERVSALLQAELDSQFGIDIEDE